MYATRRNQTAESKVFYEVPTLSNTTLLRCLREIQLPFTEEDLMKPTAQSTQYLFERCLDLLMGVHTTQIEEVRDKMLQNIEHPEVHHDMLGMLLLYDRMSKLMLELGFADFNFRDITKPTHDRIVKILSALVNYARFREERLTTFEQISATGDEIAMKRANLEQIHDETSAKLNQLKEKAKAEEPETKAKEAENEEYGRTLRDQKKNADSIHTQYQELKATQHHLRDEMQTKVYQIITLDREIERLRIRADQNPERVRSANAKLTSSIEEESQAATENEATVRRLQAKIDTISAILEEVNACNRLLSDCEEGIKNYETLNRHNAINEEKIGKKELDMQELQNKEQYLTRMLNNLMQKMAKLEQQQEKKRESVQSDMNQSQQEYSQTSSEVSKMQQQMSEIQASAELLEQQINDIKTSLEVDVSNLQSEYDNLKAQFESYLSEMKL
ncbi:hypothetical protein K450DRAFT_233545 [Umbelopsis ramanniana AG]|uniref:Kinetochore protein Nuf2 n=1 Tax=Umbelopsis ramanniana AG TaxID=1314678 RepID=A0AAD5HFY5_UMBRA|nr:uncharacterized protein K450DRAFT_233545 [Umbelopsis ramanniana AG]KAI8581191.1 hypothetical protein K450DRAFT_233545 [Umbelopsis ramanniana AG]